jgi:MarR family transcriptional regulator, negative regulator of the multidrug operon emrRAB
VADRLAQLLGALSLSATDRVRARVEGELGRAGTHAAALVHLDAYPGDSIQQLSAVLAISQPGAVKVADRLVADGLVERRPGADARTLALHLTDAGRAASGRVLADRAGELAPLLAVLDPGERANLLPLLEKLVSGLADDRPGALEVCRLCDRDTCCGAPQGCPLQHTVPA